MQVSDRIACLLEWCSKNGVVIDPRLRIGQTEDGQMGVFAEDVLDAGETVVHIPKSVVLSVKSCALAEKISEVRRKCMWRQVKGVDERMLWLAFGLYGEIALGPGSRWAEYIRSMPKRVQIGALMKPGDEGWKLMKSTDVALEMGISPQEERNPVREAVGTFFEQYVQPVMGEGASAEEFLDAYSLVSSRAFEVDVYHGLCMVAVADVFNHAGDNDVLMQTDFEVCTTCGTLSGCEHDEFLEGVDVEDICEMVTEKLVESGSEVMNSYGRLRNAALIVRYGMVEEGNEEDCVMFPGGLVNSEGEIEGNISLEEIRERVQGVTETNLGSQDPLISAIGVLVTTELSLLGSCMENAEV